MQIKQHIIKEPELIAENSIYSGVSKSSIFGWNFFFGSFYKRENKNIKKIAIYISKKADSQTYMVHLIRYLFLFCYPQKHNTHIISTTCRLCSFYQIDCSRFLMKNFFNLIICKHIT